jgi:ectoine hydroxylase-related dioxygenase (phytanoyl-CoA dioxygenase family)
VTQDFPRQPCDTSGVLTDDQLARFDTDGYVLVPDVLSADEVAAARAGAFEQVPSPEQYFADPAAYVHLTDNPFAGVINFPWASPALNRFVAHPRIVSIVRQLLGDDDIRLYKGELWTKFGGAVDYDQDHHRDFGGHTLAVPTTERKWMQITTFTYLCDVDESNGATAVVSKRHTDHIPLGRRRMDPGELRDVEVRAAGRAGTSLIACTEVFHRATSFQSPTAARYLLLADYRSAEATWTNRQAFGGRGTYPEMIEFVTNVDPATRTLLDVPPPGHPFWTPRTIADMEVRYPGIDMEPYRAASR